MGSILKKIISFIVIATLLTGCEDLFVKDFNIDIEEYQPKLVVEATLNMESGILNAEIKSTIPIVGLQKSTPLRKGSFKFFEEEQLVFNLEFDPQKVANEQNEDAEYQLNYDGSISFTRNKINVSPGKTYRIETESEGFKPVYAETTALTGLDIQSAKIDTSVIIERDFKNIEILDMGYYYSDGYLINESDRNKYYQVEINLADKSPEKNYYLLSIFKLPSPYFEWATFYTSDRALLYEHPGFGQSDGILPEQGVSAYSFTQYIASDQLFSNNNIKLTFLLQKRLLNSFTYEEITQIYPYYPPDRFELQQHKLYLKMVNISEEAYDYFSKIKRQSFNEGPFMEPINIPSNIINGFGLFTIQSTTYIPVYEFESYGLKDMFGNSEDLGVNELKIENSGY